MDSFAEHNRKYLKLLTDKLASLSPEASKKVIQDLYITNGGRTKWVFIDVLDGVYDNIGHKEES